MTELDDPAAGPAGERSRGRPSLFTVTGAHPDSDRRISDLCDVVDVIRPIVEADGGALDLLDADVATGVVTLQLSGACGSCAVSSATLDQGIDRILRDRLDWVTQVVGVVEETADAGYGGWTPKHS